jgi:hypothetical protein
MCGREELSGEFWSVGGKGKLLPGACVLLMLGCTCEYGWEIGINAEDDFPFITESIGVLGVLALLHDSIGVPGSCLIGRFNGSCFGIRILGLPPSI